MSGRDAILRAEAALAAVIVDTADLWPEERLDLERALRVLRKRAGQ